MGDGTAQGASKSEARVEIEALGLLLSGGLGQSRGRASHFDVLFGEFKRNV